MLNILAVFIICLHAGKRCKRNPQVIIEFFDLCIDLFDLRAERKFLMHDPGICLQVDGQCLSCFSASRDQALPVVHIDPLINLSVHKHDKLRISSVIPLVDL